MFPLRQKTLQKTVSPGFAVGNISPLEKEYNLRLKRVIDFIFSSFLIVALLTWLIPIIALFIKLDSKGPVFFIQKRNKRGSRLFYCIKFRTMIINEDADTRPAHQNDQRITGIGKFLRKHHIDELPQLFNVWWGDMSLVGPRPYMISDNQKYEPLIQVYSMRHRVKPGITGLAQSMGHTGILPGPFEMQKRVDLDIYYIRNWSFGLDAKILRRTFRRLCCFDH